MKKSFLNAIAPVLAVMFLASLFTLVPCDKAEADSVGKIKAKIKKILTPPPRRKVNPNGGGGVRG